MREPEKKAFARIVFRKALQLPVSVVAVYIRGSSGESVSSWMAKPC